MALILPLTKLNGALLVPIILGITLEGGYFTLPKGIMNLLEVSSMIKFLKSLLQKEEGQGLVEYALIISLVSVALIVGLGLLAGGIGAAFTSVIASL